MASSLPANLQSLCDRIGGHKSRPFCRSWLGDISDIRLGQRPFELTRKLGYEPANDFKFYQADLNTASQVLAYLCRESLAYGKPHYRKTEAQEYRRLLLTELGPDAAFWTNSTTDHIVEKGQTPSSTSGWAFSPLANATFEFGILGCNQSTGFAIWVEEED
jgi:hypothetical protein